MGGATRRSFFLFFFLILGEGIVASPFCFARSDLYKVSVKVEAIDSSIKDAKERAIALGRQQAFLKLLHRLSGSKEYASLEDFSTDMLAEYVKSFGVQHESFSNSQYHALLVFEFDPEKIRTILQKHHIAFSEDEPMRVVLLPLLMKNGNLILWDEEENLWYKTWKTLEEPEGNVEVICPLADLEDRTLVDIQVLSDLKQSALMGLKNRYKADDVLVAILFLEPSEGEGEEKGGVKAYLRFLPFALQGTRDIQSIGPFDIPVDYGSLLAEKRDQILQMLSNHWEEIKRKTQAGQGVVKVKILINSPAHWGHSLKKIQGLSFVQDVKIHSLSKNEAILWVWFKGSLSHLKEKMVYEGLVVEGDLDLLVVR